MSSGYLIKNNFNLNPSANTRGQSHDIFKACDEVRHKVLLSEVKSYGITNNYLFKINSRSTRIKSEICLK